MDQRTFGLRIEFPNEEGRFHHLADHAETEVAPTGRLRLSITATRMAAQSRISTLWPIMSSENGGLRWIMP
jgi:hypothetical protein